MRGKRKDIMQKIKERRKMIPFYFSYHFVKKLKLKGKEATNSKQGSKKLLVFNQCVEPTINFFCISKAAVSEYA